MSAWTYRHSDGKAARKIVPPRSRTPYWKGPSADSEEKHEPASDSDTVVVDSLKALDPERPIREADILDLGRSHRLHRYFQNSQRLRCAVKLSLLKILLGLAHRVCDVREEQH